MVSLDSVDAVAIISALSLANGSSSKVTSFIAWVIISLSKPTYSASSPKQTRPIGSIAPKGLPCKISELFLVLGVIITIPLYPKRFNGMFLLCKVSIKVNSTLFNHPFTLSSLDTWLHSFTLTNKELLIRDTPIQTFPLKYPTLSFISAVFSTPGTAPYIICRCLLLTLAPAQRLL